MTTATQEAYGQALAELIAEKKDIVVLDADLTKSTKTAEAKKGLSAAAFEYGHRGREYDVCGLRDWPPAARSSIFQLRDVRGRQSL